MTSQAIPGDVFHAGGRPVYAEPVGWAVYKRHDAMAQVVYADTHLNVAERGDRRGHGLNHATWVFAEEEGLKEGLLRSGIELFIDGRLEPGAAVGLHAHATTEEIYYLLEGQLTITTVRDEEEATATLQPGDAHLIRPGQSHFAVAGPDGARFITVAARV